QLYLVARRAGERTHRSLAHALFGLAARQKTDQIVRVGADEISIPPQRVIQVRLVKQRQPPRVIDPLRQPAELLDAVGDFVSNCWHPLPDRPPRLEMIGMEI